MTRRTQTSQRKRNVTKAKKAGAQLGGDLFTHPGADTVTGEIEKTVIDQIDALPFVKTLGRGKGRCYWSVKSSGNYSKDYAQGVAWSTLILPLLRYNGGPPLFSWIVVDMVKAGKKAGKNAGKHDGLMLGFTRGIAEHLQAAKIALAGFDLAHAAAQNAFIQRPAPYSAAARKRRKAA
jgi:hypothetical protein